MTIRATAVPIPPGKLDLLAFGCSQEGGPLGSREGQHGCVGMFGVADGGSAREVSDLNAVLQTSAVAAFTPCLLLDHWAHSSSDLITFLTRSIDSVGLNAADWVRLNITLNSLTSSSSSMYRIEVGVST